MKKLRYTFAIIATFLVGIETTWAGFTAEQIETINKKKTEVQALVEQYPGYTGCCPRVNWLSTLCCCICCPCCIPCLADGTVHEVCSTPTERIEATRETIRKDLLEWRQVLVAGKDSEASTDAYLDAYNTYVRSIYGETNQSKELRLFKNEEDLEVFLIK